MLVRGLPLYQDTAGRAAGAYIHFGFFVSGTSWAASNSLVARALLA
jgi:hypothetical protein